MNQQNNQQKILLLVFALSGATGLIYESVWSHYLKQFLGHAAYAQSMVLIIFMGGMALGAWLISRYGNRIQNMLMGYALIEGVIGIIGLLFHTIYNFAYDISFNSIIPEIGATGMVYVYKTFIASLLILPQSILLGTTFPLMSGGFIRKFPDTPGHSISFLYFTNSIGAAAAVLISAFYLIAKAGLPGTMLTAGLINILISISIYFIAKDQDTEVKVKATESIQNNWIRLILCAAFFTGMGSFIYEIAWIRMLSMVLGASTHSFELMLSAFITGLGIGGFWIRKRIEKLENPVYFAAMIQIIMACFALLTIVLYNNSFYLQSFFMSALKESDEGYLLYNLTSHAIALLIMLPTTICAGMTLPLFTYILINRGHGERSIGQIYSSNTIGAIFGVIFTVFIGMPLFSLKGAIISGAIIDAVIGILLLRSIITNITFRPAAYSIFTAGMAIFLIAIFTRFDTSLMASSVFRGGLSDSDYRSEVIYHKDGRTASVSVTNWRDVSLSIITNGKPDAAMSIADDAPPSTDESTMTLLGALPLTINPDAEEIANIGLGSGLTSHVLLGSPRVSRVDTIEIESAMVEGAKLYGRKTERVYNDPRSHIHIEDAKTYFSTHQSKYDVIISEPSNPWVSGVSSLFTREFYKTVNSHLNTNGKLVQWIHIYEFNLDLLVSVLKAIASEFSYYSIYFADDGNLLLVASNDREVPMARDDIFDAPEIKSQLATIFVNNIDDVLIRFLGDQDIFNAYIAHSPVPINSDFFPYLDQNATKARYLKEDVKQILNLRVNHIPILDLLYTELPARRYRLSATEFFDASQIKAAENIYSFFSDKVFDKNNIEAIASVNFLNAAAANCNTNYNRTVWIDSVYMIFSSILPYLTEPEINEMLEAFNPDCNEDRNTNSHITWLRLFQAISNKDYNEINRTSATLLSGFHFNDVEQKKYLQTVFLIGLIKTGAHQNALDYWRDEMAEIFIVNGEIPLEYEILLAQIQVQT